MGAFTAALFTAIHLLVSKGIIYCIASLVSYGYLKFIRRFFGRRFDLYDFYADSEPEKLSFFVPQEEYKLESPQSAVHLKKNADSVFFMGVNSQSESLTVQISRKPCCQVQCSLVLRLSNGHTYTLPEEHSIQPEIDEPHTFGASRLKLQCLSPMRRWRVFFNGTLKETSSDKASEVEYRHVRFSFLWVASSDVFDYSTDMSPTLLTDAAASHGSWKWPPILLLQRLKSIFDSYDQCGMFLGTVTLEGEPEREMYLWGCRGRYMGRTYGIKDGDFEDIYVNSENGTFIHLGIINITGMIKNFAYGFVMRPNGYIFPVEKCLVLEEDGTTKKYRCFSGKEEYTIKVSKENAQMSFQKQYGGESSVTHACAFVNVMKGRSLIYEGKIEPQPQLEQGARKHKISFTTKNDVPSMYIPLLSLPFQDPHCQLLNLSGGKGSSLAKLSVISDELKNFIVPKGIVVTTAAYKTFIQGKLSKSVEKFEKAAWKMSKDNIKSECDRLVEEVSKAELLENVKQSIQVNLHKIFGEEFVKKKFAIRSSATGEDTEQMSAAGQMETFLGCNGLTEIFEALKKCWASQFSHTAVEYKRRYGQPLNTPMAVVIQEMVPCEAAGVIFTCDPVTGNPSYVSITANYGLGESVVAASVDPDTMTLGRDLYHGITFHSQSAGMKKSKIVMDDTGGTREIHVEEVESNEYCISRETALVLGEIAVKIEEIFATPRDIEWGVLDGQVYLFQSRPVTSLDIETDFEIKHCRDSHIRREDEYSSTANIGEVFSGAVSPLGLSLLMRNFDISMSRHKYVRWDGETLPATPYMEKRIVTAFSHPLFCVSDAFFRFSENEGDEISNHTKALTVAMFGRVIEDKKIFDMAKDRHKDDEQSGMSLLAKIWIVVLMFFAGYFCKKTNRRINKFRIPIKKNSSSAEILRTIALNFHEINGVVNMHLDCTFSSAFWNNAILGLLTEARGVCLFSSVKKKLYQLQRFNIHFSLITAWDNEAFSDFAFLLSTCSHVESADVPSAIQKLGYTICRCLQSEEFKKMSVEDALAWLQTSPSEAGIQFRNLLTKHGHRCLKEFDVYSIPWGQDPKPLVKMLQDLVGPGIKDPVEKEQLSFGAIVSHLNVKLGFLERLKLRLLLPNCQRGVREREFSKSTLVKAWDRIREALYKLADVMVEEGRLPNRELLFFLEIEEVRQLVDTRSPRLVAKAFRRWKFHPELDRLIFPEIMIGIPKPVNMNEDTSASETGFTMTGVPVSQGVVRGTARIVLNLQDAHEIQLGDILITYATDIGWSPYFALLSGVATELGGLISHGAVVAREYGLPCVVNLHGASRAFRSGDRVLLDGNQGLLQKIEDI